MRLKAMLVCEDVRFELGGTVTLVGVVNDRLIVPAGEGPIELPRLACFATVAGVRGASRIAFRQWLRDVEDELPDEELRDEPHDEAADEHNFVFSQQPMVFPQPGRYEVGLEIEVGGERARYACGFAVERRAP